MASTHGNRQSVRPSRCASTPSSDAGTDVAMGGTSEHIRAETSWAAHARYSVAAIFLRCACAVSMMRSHRLRWSVSAVPHARGVEAMRRRMASRWGSAASRSGYWGASCTSWYGMVYLDHSVRGSRLSKPTVMCVSHGVACQVDVHANGLVTHDALCRLTLASSACRTAVLGTRSHGWNGAVTTPSREVPIKVLASDFRTSCTAVVAACIRWSILSSSPSSLPTRVCSCRLKAVHRIGWVGDWLKPMTHRMERVSMASPPDVHMR